MRTDCRKHGAKHWKVAARNEAWSLLSVMERRWNLRVDRQLSGGVRMNEAVVGVEECVHSTVCLSPGQLSKCILHSW